MEYYLYHCAYGTSKTNLALFKGIKMSLKNGGGGASYFNNITSIIGETRN